jgi:hypothetical protein
MGKTKARIVATSGPAGNTKNETPREAGFGYCE